MLTKTPGGDRLALSALTHVVSPIPIVARLTSSLPDAPGVGVAVGVGVAQLIVADVYDHALHE